MNADKFNGLDFEDMLLVFHLRLSAADWRF